ncbi:hypothetical protein [Ectobacillus ponti]|uniref:Uncharacterized protein n=1 Tax=Ectobacillus ponti TaxID=2961894 RepID=A0AA42BS54_9BACI|nr:hypothetical protein [Ectobacillus ponti]MCP8968083.1 hypothetical protein [Ectobacillus ponti]
MTNEAKKVSLQEAMKQMLEQKKQAQAGGKLENGLVKTTKGMKSQQTKKPNNQRRRTGV